MQDYNRVEEWLEIQAQCKNGCSSHAKGEWREHKRIPSGMPLSDAREILALTQAVFHKSTFRLVRIITVESQKTRVL